MPIIPRNRLITPADMQRANRIIEKLQQQVAGLRKQLGDRRSPEGRDATIGVILHKEAQIHRLRSYLGESTVPTIRPPITFEKPTPKPQPIPPKGSVINKRRAAEARIELQNPPPPPAPVQISPPPKPPSGYIWNPRKDKPLGIVAWSEPNFSAPPVNMSASESAAFAKKWYAWIDKVDNTFPFSSSPPKLPPVWNKDTYTKWMRSVGDWMKSCKHEIFLHNRSVEQREANLKMSAEPVTKKQVTITPHVLPPQKRAELENQLKAIEVDLKKVDYTVNRYNVDSFVRMAWAGYLNPERKTGFRSQAYWEKELRARNSPPEILKTMVKRKDGKGMTSTIIASHTMKIQNIKRLLNQKPGNLGLATPLRDRISEKKTREAARLRVYVTQRVMVLNRKGNVRKEGVEKAYALVRDFDKGYLGTYATAMGRIDQTLMLHMDVANRSRNAQVIRKWFVREYTAMKRNNMMVSNEGLEAINATFHDYEMSKRFVSHEDLQQEIARLMSQHRRSQMTAQQLQGIGVINAMKHKKALAKVNPAIENLTLQQSLAYEGSREAMRQVDATVEQVAADRASLAGAFSATRQAMESLLS